MAWVGCSYIVDLPLLIQSSVLLPDQDILVVLVLSSGDVKHKASFVDKVLALQWEVLMPDILFFTESAVSSSSLISDVQRDIGISLWLDASSLWVEDEDLIVFAAIWNISDDNIVSWSCQGTCSSHLGDDSERLVRNDTILNGVSINIGNLPVLVERVLSVLLPDNNVLSISILWSWNVKNKASFILNEFTIKDEVLVPSSVGLVSNQISRLEIE